MPGTSIIVLACVRVCVKLFLQFTSVSEIMYLLVKEVAVSNEFLLPWYHLRNLTLYLNVALPQ
jgi:hypothetical protein